VRTMEVTAKVKAAGVADGLAEGQFRALVSVFDNEDTYGDVVRPGAFAQTLMDWAAKGDSIPVIWSHQWSDPFSHVGHVVEAKETAEGLEVLGQIDDLTVGDDENPTAKQVYRLLKGRRVTQFSFAYDVPNGGGAWVKDDNHRWGGYYELRQVDLHEVGPCLLGVNRETELLAAKAAHIAAGAKAGRVLSQSNFDTLTSAYESIGEVLAAAAPEPDPEAEKARAGRPRRTPRRRPASPALRRPAAPRRPPRPQSPRPPRPPPRTPARAAPRTRPPRTPAKHPTRMPPRPVPFPPVCAPASRSWSSRPRSRNRR
jgi:HK97 family phage prohead protease